jgi:tRNA U34 2-thiouridine synthase MnmA/TrmU
MSGNSKSSVIVGVRSSLDSVATVILLQRQGLDVSAVHVQTENKELCDSLKINRLKCQEESPDNLRKICDALGVPLYVSDMKQIFAEEVVDSALNAELLKYDFHPCFQCAKIKLIVLYQKMLKLENDFFAAGYFAKLRIPSQSSNAANSDIIQVSAAKDTKYDQAPLVAQAPLSLMSKLLLPLGDMMKDDVYNIVKNSVSPALFSMIVTGKENHQQRCGFFQDRAHALQKSFPPNYLPKLRAYWRDTKTYMNESFDLVHCHAGEEIKPPGGSLSGSRDSSLIVAKIDYTKRDVDVGSRDACSFDVCQVKIIQKIGDLESFRPIPVFCRFNLDEELHAGVISFRGLGFGTIHFEKIIPFHPLRCWVTIYEKNEKTLKCIFSSRLLSFWKNSEGGDPFFTPFDKLKEYPL